MIVHVGEINAEYKKLFPKMIVFAITNNDELIGIIKLTKVKHEFNTFEICWIIDPQYQRMGFAYEAAIAVIDYARKHKAKKITAHADIKNIPSIGLIEKLGFVRDGEVNQRIYPNQEKSFELTYALDL